MAGNPPHWAYSIFGSILAFLGIAIFVVVLIPAYRQKVAAKALLESGTRVAAAVIDDRVIVNEGPDTLIIGLEFERTDLAGRPHRVRQEFEVSLNSAFEAARTSRKMDVVYDPAVPSLMGPTAEVQLLATRSQLIAKLLSCTIGALIIAGGIALAASIIAQQVTGAAVGYSTAMFLCFFVAGAVAIPLAVDWCAKKGYRRSLGKA